MERVWWSDRHEQLSDEMTAFVPNTQWQHPAVVSRVIVGGDERVWKRPKAELGGLGKRMFWNESITGTL